jgi:hypothetical protein
MADAVGSGYRQALRFIAEAELRVHFQTEDKGK